MTQVTAEVTVAPAINGARYRSTDSTEAATGMPKDVTETNVDDCASLLGAVATRLREVVGGDEAEPGLAAITAAVLECAQALQQVQVLLTNECGRYARIQAIAEDVRDEPEQARQDLAPAKTRGGPTTERCTTG